MRLFRKNRKIIKLVIFLLLPVLVYGLIKLALWYNTKTSLENLSKQASGFAELNYKTISSSLKGSVSVNDLTIFIPMVKESIHIKRIRLSADNVISLLSLNYKFESGELPKSMALVIEGLKVSLNSKLLNSLENTKQTPFERFTTLACGDVQRFDEKALSKMGYSDIETDFNINYNYDKLAKTLNFNLYQNMDRFYSLDFTAQLNAVEEIPKSSDIVMGVSGGTISQKTMSQKTMPQNAPQLGKLQLTINDDSFITRKVTYCAGKNNSDQQTYINKHIAMANEYLKQLGITLHQSLIDAYQKSLSHPGNVIISMDFSDVADPMELSNYLLDDIISQLNTQLFVNNKPISPISIQIDQQRFNSSTDKSAADIKIDDPNVKLRVIKKYHLVNKNKLSQYNKHRAIIKTTLGKTYKGQLIIISPTKYEIKVRSHGGEIGYFVKKSEIKTIEVFY